MFEIILENSSIRLVVRDFSSRMHALERSAKFSPSLAVTSYKTEGALLVNISY
jgi:hypothetical protein